MSVTQIVVMYEVGVITKKEGRPDMRPFDFAEMLRGFSFAHAAHTPIFCVCLQTCIICVP